MMKKQRISDFVKGFLCAALGMAAISTAVAATTLRTIDVHDGINIYVDDKKLNPTDVNGQPVDVFLYNGTTYLPVRAISNVFGQEIAWDGATTSVYIGKHTAVAAPDASVVASGPLETGYAPLDEFSSQIRSRIITSGMSDRDKLYAIYQYVKSNMTYNMLAESESGLVDDLLVRGYSSYDAGLIALAYDAAKYRSGVCDNYSALTMVLARAEGIPLWQFGGKAAGGSSHAWNILVSDGKKYLVDTNYGQFMTDFASSGYTEQMDGREFFNFFRTTAPSTDSKKISWMFNDGASGNKMTGNTNGTVNRSTTVTQSLYSYPKGEYTTPICPIVTVEGNINTFSATVSSDGKVIETLPEQSGDKQSYYFTWYPKQAGSYVIEITAKSDSVFEGHFVMNVQITE